MAEGNVVSVHLAYRATEQMHGVGEARTAPAAPLPHS